MIITIKNRDTTVETQIETIDTDNVLVVTIDITRTIVIETIEGIRQTEKNNRHHSREQRTDGNKYNSNNNRNRINNVETERQNDDPPGIDENEYTSESSNENQKLLDKF